MTIFATALVKAMCNPQAVNVVVPYTVLQMMAAGAVCMVAVMNGIQLQVAGPYPYRVSTGLRERDIIGFFRGYRRVPVESGPTQRLDHLP